MVIEYVSTDKSMMNIGNRMVSAGIGIASNRVAIGLRHGA